METLKDKDFYWAELHQKPEHCFARIVSCLIKGKRGLNRFPDELRVVNKGQIFYYKYCVLRFDIKGQPNKSFFMEEEVNSNKKAEAQIAKIISILFTLKLNIDSFNFILLSESNESNFDYFGYISDYFSCFYKEEQVSSIKPLFFKSCSAKVFL